MAIYDSVFDFYSFYFSVSSTVIAITVFIALLCVCIVLGHLLENNRWANESTTAIILGLLAGLLVLLFSKGAFTSILVFNEELFFIYLLPPIIFNAGFQVKKKQFFHNFSTIFLFGALGTVISFCLISSCCFFIFKRIGFTSLTIKDILAIGAILSATDSVCALQVLNQEETPFLYSIVFGEGVVNDATSIVLFNSVQTLNSSEFSAVTILKFIGTFCYLFFTSTLLGVIVGLVSAYVIKTLYFGRHSTDREVAVMMLLAYFSYIVAELLDLSGILTIFFCGIFMSHYTWHNVTESSRVTTKHSFATISFIAETFIFLYVGMDAMDIEKWRQSKTNALVSISLSSTLLLLVLVGRATSVFSISNLSNCFKRNGKIELRQQFVVWWAGLMRGAITIALTYNQFNGGGREYALIITSTIIVVLFSTVVFGSITKPMIEEFLFSHTKPSSSCDSLNFTSLEDLRLLFLEGGGEESLSGYQPPATSSNLQLLLRYPTSTVHYFWRKFDDKYMRPIFGGRGFVPRIPGSPASDVEELIS